MIAEITHINSQVSVYAFVHILHINNTIKFMIHMLIFKY